MDSAEELPRVLSLCSGYGGIEEGIRRVLGEISILAHVEIEAFAIANLVNKMEAGRMAPVPIWTDLKTLPLEPFRGITDILTGGYPCQPFSNAGNRKGEDDPRHLWPYIRHAVAIIRPAMCFFENVEGHISLGLRGVLADLASLGYSVENIRKEPTWGIFSAEEVGAPHRRKRVFILAHRVGSQWRPQPESTYKPHGSNAGREEATGRSWKCGQELAYRVGEGPQGYAGDEQNEAGSRRPRQDRPTPESGLSLGDSPCNDKWRLPEQIGDGPRMPYRGSGARWPARPGEQQFEWEEPRVIKSGLGGAPDGSRDRVDRLRLLGNGVVPAVAEKAFRILLERMLS